tara:strand:+ start:147 stop:599 length:453 start_codon:yes stop_codon:yes gene_type:complete
VRKVLIFIILIGFDLITKYFVKKNLNLNQSIKLNEFLDLVYVQNYGVSFGFLSNKLPYWFFVLVGLIIALIIFYLMIIATKKIEKYAYFIIILGAMGNILDRFINTYVVDFISLHYNNYYWPAFNLADIYITIGIIMLLLTFFTNTKDKQ